jgi:hypothetical protein|nr:MAG TPA: hypothetical protein [Caudoviricetes sp.]
MIKITDEIIETKIDKDIIDFLKAVYFGDFTDSLKAASSRAYRDMNRTIRFNGLPDATRLALRAKVNTVFGTELLKLNYSCITSQDEFNAWHRSVSDSIKTIYLNEGIRLTYGQAQKWINMTIKYLYMIEAYTFDDVFEFLHIPLDNYVFDIARDSLGITRPKVAWSSWDNYEKQYLQYQNLIREKIDTGSPLRWEFRYWLKVARNIEE